MAAREIRNIVENIDPSAGLAVIDRDFTVEWVNKSHLGRWPDLVGQTCYRYINGFSEPCEWCPVKQTFVDGKMHDELVNYSLEDNVVCCNIVSMPLAQVDGEVAKVLEIVFDTNEREDLDFQKRADRYEVFTEFGAVLERLPSEHVPDYLLLGAVWGKCLDFPIAEVLTLDKER